MDESIPNWTKIKGCCTLCTISMDPGDQWCATRVAIGSVTGYNICQRHTIHGKQFLFTLAVELIRHTFKHLDKESFLYLHKSLVHPHLEYASVIWSAKMKKHQDCLFPPTILITLIIVCASYEILYHLYICTKFLSYLWQIYHYCYSSFFLIPPKIKILYLFFP